jgi:hypothetical protein
VQYDGFSLFAARDHNIFPVFQIHKMLGLGQGCQEGESQNPETESACGGKPSVSDNILSENVP